MNFSDKKILHVKIPKNGTHSINKVLIYKDFWKRDYFFGHDPLYVLEKNNLIDEDVFIFCVSRNPFTRFYSQYHQFIKIEPNYKNKSFLNFKRDIETNELINFIGDVRKEEFNFLFTEKQTSWIKTYCNTKINKIYKLENIVNFEQDFKIKLNFCNYSKYSIKHYKNSFDEEIINFVLDFYDEDFYKFEYKKNFNDSIEELHLMRKNLFYYN